MGILEDVMKALERVPGWRRIAATPDRVDALEAKIKAIEDRLDVGKGAACPRCKEPAFIMKQSRPAPGSMGRLGLKTYSYSCSACGYQEEHQGTAPPL